MPHHHHKRSGRQATRIRSKEVVSPVTVTPFAALPRVGIWKDGAAPTKRPPTKKKEVSQTIGSNRGERGVARREANIMTMAFGHRSNHLSARSRLGFLYSDAFLVGLSRGAYLPLGQRPHHSQTRIRESTPTFEETIANQEFAPLVRWSVALARWLAGICKARPDQRLGSHRSR